MLSFKPPGTSNKGFTLIELIIGIGLTGMLISLSFSVFDTTSRISKQVSIEDDFLLQGRFAIEYIRDDITEDNKDIRSIQIVSMKDYLPDKFNYTDTLGFFIVKEEKKEFNHIFYKLEGETLSRVSFGSPIKLPKNMTSDKGNNPVLENVSSIKDSYYDKENELLCLIIKTKDKSRSKEYKFMETLYLRDDIKIRGLD